MKNPFPGIKERLSKTTTSFRIIALIIFLVLFYVLYLIFWRTPPADPIIAQPPSEVVRLQGEVRSLKEDISSEEKKTTSALAEVDRLKEYQVTLLDSIQKLQPKQKPDTKKYVKKVTRNIVRRKTPNNCNCPPVTRANTQTAWAKYGIPTP